MPDDQVEAAVVAALDAGYRHVDTARLYGNEAGVGRRPGRERCRREDVFVTTKVWNNDHGRDATLRAFDASMGRLGARRARPVPHPLAGAGPRRYVETWQALRELRDDGRVRAIGVCNFHAPHLQRLFDETGEWPSINQVELHPYLQQSPLREFDAEHGIVTESWSRSPRASGCSTTRSSARSRSGTAPPRRRSSSRGTSRSGWWCCRSRSRRRGSSRTSPPPTSTLTDDDLAEIAGLDRGFRTGPNPDEFNGA